MYITAQFKDAQLREHVPALLFCLGKSSRSLYGDEFVALKFIPLLACYQDDQYFRWFQESQEFQDSEDCQACHN